MEMRKIMNVNIKMRIEVEMKIKVRFINSIGIRFGIEIRIGKSQENDDKR